MGAQEVHLANMLLLFFPFSDSWFMLKGAVSGWAKVKQWTVRAVVPGVADGTGGRSGS